MFPKYYLLPEIVSSATSCHGLHVKVYTPQYGAFIEFVWGVGDGSLLGITEKSLRDWSLITGGGGGLQNGKIAGPKLFAPPLKTG